MSDKHYNWRKTMFNMIWKFLEIVGTTGASLVPSAPATPVKSVVKTMAAAIPVMKKIAETNEQREIRLAIRRERDRARRTAKRAIT
jgi:hypothetical protein